MARRKVDVLARQAGLRERLIAVTETEFRRFRDRSMDWYDYGPECERFEARLAALRAGEEVQFRRWGDGKVGEYWPAAGVPLCVPVGDELRPVELSQ